ncbi:MAG: helix-turn-helix domain-containing protein, partial [Rubrobacter sp.]|nr:helix-turn-helix domain-containing protein [Rubrobacter sp.]
ANRKPEKRQQAPPEGFTAATLWEARLSDLQRLRELRFMDAQMADYRHRWLFVCGVGMSWLASSPQAMRRELFELAREAGSWSEDHAAGKLSSVVSRTKRAFAGEWVEWRGEMLDPRYRLTNQRIIEWLEIGASEESHMKTLVSSDERRRRDRQRKEPEMSRDEYEGRAADRRSEARRMAAEGLSQRQIARRLKINQSTVSRALREG